MRRDAWKQQDVGSRRVDREFRRVKRGEWKEEDRRRVERA